MGIGMALLINGIIGLILYPILVYSFVFLCYRKFGKDASDEGLDDAIHDSNLGYDLMSNGDESKRSLLITLSWFISIFLWEIGMPINLYMIYIRIRK